MRQRNCTYICIVIILWDSNTLRSPVGLGLFWPQLSAALVGANEVASGHSLAATREREISFIRSRSVNDVNRRADDTRFAALRWKSEANVEDTCMCPANNAAVRILEVCCECVLS